MTDDRAHHHDDLPCTEEVELITDYLEGALPDAERRRLERHLAARARRARSTSRRCGRSPARSAGCARRRCRPRCAASLIAAFRAFRSG